MSVERFLVSQLLFAGVELEVQAGGDNIPGKESRDANRLGDGAG
jgi:hypothetical protein